MRTNRRRRAMLLALLVCAIPLGGAQPVTASALFTVSRPVGANTVTSRNSFGLSQLAGTAGCVSDDGTSGTCVDGIDIQEIAGMAVTSDGANVYAAVYTGSGLLVFSRNAATGELTQLGSNNGCITNAAVTGCTTGRVLAGPWGVALSPDDKFLYAASYTSDAVAVFSRNTTTGVLTQLAGTSGCVSNGGVSGCASGTALDAPDGVAVSPDGNYVYVASYNSNALAVFSRDTTTGVLTQLGSNNGCVTNVVTAGCTTGKALGGATEVRISPDGTSVYVASYADGAIAVFSRNTGTGVLTQLAGTAGCVSGTGSGGACTTQATLTGIYDVTVSPDGANVYAASYDTDAVTALSRNTGTSALTALSGTSACITHSATAGCVTGATLDGAEGVVVSPDGQDVYVVAHNSDALDVFGRDPTTGALTQWPATRGCITNTAVAGCVTGKGLESAHRVAVTPDGKDIYTAGGYDPAGPGVYGWVDAFARSR